MMPKERFGGTFRFLAKGDFPDLLLVVLQDIARANPVTYGTIAARQLILLTPN